MTIDDFKTGVTVNITTQTHKKSINPQTVGNAFTDLADIVTFVASFLSGTTIDTNSFIKNQNIAGQIANIWVNGGIKVDAVPTSLNSVIRLDDLNIVQSGLTESINDLSGTTTDIITNLNNYIQYNGLTATTLVSPTINVIWSSFKNDGVTVYNLSNPNTKNLIVDKGAKVSQNSSFSYPFPSSGQSVPTAVSGSYGTVIPAPTVNSEILNTSGITTNQSYNVILIKPKTGLIIQGNQVIPATGNDTINDSISVSFNGKGYLFYSTNGALLASDINTLIATTASTLNGGFQTTVGRTYSSVTAGVALYTYIIYDASFNDISNIIMNGATPVLGAFIKQSNLTIINEAGLSIAYKIYRSNITQAFTNATLVIT